MESGPREIRQTVDTSILIILNELVIDKLQNYIKEIKENIQSEESNEILKAQEFLDSFIEAREKIKNKEIQPKGYRNALKKLNDQMKTADVDFIDANLLLKEAQDIAAKAVAQVKRYQDKGFNMLAQINESMTASQKGKIFTVAAAYYNMAMRTNKISANDHSSSQKFFEMASDEAKRNGIDVMTDPDFRQRIQNFLLRNEAQNEFKNELKPSPSNASPTFLPLNAVREGAVGQDVSARDALSTILYNNILSKYWSLKGDPETLPMLKLHNNLEPIKSMLINNSSNVPDGDLNGIVRTIRDHIQDAEDSIFITAQDKKDLQSLNKAIDRFVSSYNKAVDEHYLAERKISREAAAEKLTIKNPAATKLVGRPPAPQPNSLQTPLSFSSEEGVVPDSQHKSQPVLPPRASQQRNLMFSHEEGVNIKPRQRAPAPIAAGNNETIQKFLGDQIAYLEVFIDGGFKLDKGVSMIQYTKGIEVLEKLRDEFKTLQKAPSFTAVTVAISKAENMLKEHPQQSLRTVVMNIKRDQVVEEAAARKERVNVAAAEGKEENKPRFGKS